MKNRSKFGFLMSTFLILGSVPVQVQGAENTTSSTAKSELLESLDSSINSTSTTNSSIEPSTTMSSTAESSEISSENVESASSDTAVSQDTKTSAEITSESTEEATTTSSTDHEGEELVTRPNRSDLHPSVRQARSGIMTIDPSKNKNTPRLDFIDVSSHNGSISVSQYKSMKKYGVKSVVIKLTEGTSYRNGYAKEQMQNAQLAGLRVHVYHYSWFTTVAKAKAEAAYFVKYAKEIGVPKTAFFINDLEDESIKYTTNNHTANSQAFSNQIKALGYPNTQHYLGKAWLTEGRINATQLGLSNCWIAQYPYTPTASQTWNSDYGSWQWSSAVQFPGVSSLFDISIDYSGKLTSYVDDQGPYLSYGKYFTPTSGSYAIYSSFNWTQSDTTKNHLNKTYLAKGMYQHSNGNTYLSLYDNQNKWVGYVDAAAGSVSDNPQGNWMGMKKYVKVNGSYDLYSNFGTTVKNSGSSLKNQVYRATGVYYHFNGNTYYSLYDSVNKWMGYIDNRGVETLPDQGLYQNFNQYVSFSAKNQPIYSSFAWHQSANTSTYQNKTYLAKGVYHHLNGKDYYSVYDGADHWLGYVEAGNCQIQSTPGGQWYSYKKYFKVKGNYALYSDFTKTVMHSGDSQKNQQYKATGVYYHFNGNTYYSLYDSVNKWMGYIDSRGVETLPDQGLYQNFNQYVSFSAKNQPIYSSFAWHQSANTSTYQNKTYLAKGVYHHLNGKDYYSVYDGADHWLGYVEAGNCQIQSTPGGQWYSYKKYFKVKGNYALYSDFTKTVMHSGDSQKNQQYKATGVYYHFNGNTYYSLYDSVNKWMGYIDSRGVETLPDQGLYQNFNQYVSFSAKNQPIYSSFAWHQSANTSTYQNKTYLAKGVYHHLNGKDYYSVYDGADHWLGYVEAGNCQIQSTPGGQWYSYKKYFKVKGNYALYSDFTKTVMHSGDSQKNQQYKATGVYYHFNGNTYYSLYDSTNKWMGYIDSRGVEEIPDQGLYHGFNKSFKITQKDQSIYSSFAWRVSGSTTTYLNKIVEAAGVYHHMNGKDYYSLYQNGKWIGYVEASVGKVVK